MRALVSGRRFSISTLHLGNCGRWLRSSIGITRPYKSSNVRHGRNKALSLRYFSILVSHLASSRVETCLTKTSNNIDLYRSRLIRHSKNLLTGLVLIVLIGTRTKWLDCNYSLWPLAFAVTGTMHSTSLKQKLVLVLSLRNHCAFRFSADSSLYLERFRLGVRTPCVNDNNTNTSRSN